MTKTLKEIRNEFELDADSEPEFDFELDLDFDIDLNFDIDLENIEFDFDVIDQKKWQNKTTFAICERWYKKTIGGFVRKYKIFQSQL